MLRQQPLGFLVLLRQPLLFHLHQPAMLAHELAAFDCPGKSPQQRASRRFGHAAVRVRPDLIRVLQRRIGGDVRVVLHRHLLHVTADLGENGYEMAVHGSVIGGFVGASVAPLLEGPNEGEDDENTDDGKNNTSPGRRRRFGSFDGTNLFFGDVLLHRGSHGVIVRLSVF